MMMDGWEIDWLGRIQTASEKAINQSVFKPIIQASLYPLEPVFQLAGVPVYFLAPEKLFQVLSISIFVSCIPSTSSPSAFLSFFPPFLPLSLSLCAFSVILDRLRRPVRVVMSTHDNADSQSESVADAVTAMKLDQVPSADANGGPIKKDPDEPNNTTTPASMNGHSSSPTSKSPSQSQTPVKKDEDPTKLEEKVGGGITVKLEPGQPPKLARSSSQKVVARPPPLFLDLPNSTAEAQSTFELMGSCTYANKYMGYTEHAMECDCAEEWRKYFSFLSFFSPFCSPLILISFVFYATRIVKSNIHLFSPFFVFLTTVPRAGYLQKCGLRGGLGLYQPRYED